MPITDWPLDDRPREKLLEKGAATLSDAELLAIFLRTGVRGRTAVDVARDLLREFGSLTELCGASRERFCSFPGLGNAKFAQLQAATELVKRALASRMKLGNNLNSPAAVKDYLRLNLEHRQVEVFMGLFLDAQNRVIAMEELFSGTLTQTSVFPREVVRRALFHNAAGVIFSHNHPSGIAEPSHADESLTRVLAQALALVDVRVLDHLIVGKGSVLSFAEKGIL
ncbi:MAG: DNA repair protein RadC [Burkholderiales bacterium]